jgi:hypothetical protein
MFMTLRVSIIGIINMYVDFISSMVLNSLFYDYEYMK